VSLLKLASACAPSPPLTTCGSLRVLACGASCSPSPLKLSNRSNPSQTSLSASVSRFSDVPHRVGQMDRSVGLARVGALHGPSPLPQRKGAQRRSHNSHVRPRPPVWRRSSFHHRNPGQPRRAPLRASVLARRRCYSGFTLSPLPGGHGYRLQPPDSSKVDLTSKCNSHQSLLLRTYWTKLIARAPFPKACRHSPCATGTMLETWCGHPQSCSSHASIH